MAAPKMSGQNLEFHAFADDGRGYVYFPLEREVFVVEKRSVGVLKDRNPANTWRRYRLLTDMKSRISRKTSQDARDSPDEQHRIAGLFLCVANTCNLSCVYCFAQNGTYGASVGLMPTTIGVNAVNQFLDRIPKNRRTHIIFFGGEPLLCWDVVRTTYESTSKRVSNEGRNVRFHLVTNGTLLDHEKVTYLSRCDMSVTVSIDGGRDLHDRQRPFANGTGSFEAATRHLAALLSGCGSRVGVRATYASMDYPLTQAFDDLFEIGFHRVELSPDILHLSERDVPMLLSRLDSLVDHAISRFTERGFLGHLPIAYRIERMLGGFTFSDVGCSAGRSIFAVAPDGRIYPCHRFASVSSMCVGQIQSNEWHERDFFTSGRSLPCVSCWNRYMCSISCFYNNYERNTDPLRPLRVWCLYSQKISEVALRVLARIPCSDQWKLLPRRAGVSQRTGGSL